MKRLLLLLLVITANLVVSSKGNDIEVQLPPKILQRDLQAIEYYFNKVNNDIDAFVLLPNNIGFLMSWNSQSGNYIKIQGIFKVSTDVYTAYDGLYFKEGKFYVMKDSSLQLISGDTSVYYSQHSLPTRYQYLSIKYFGLDEIKKLIGPLHSNYKMDPASPPASYLAITPGRDHLIEYTLWSKYWSNRVVDGNLRVLIGKEEKPNRVILSENIEAFSVVLNQTRDKVFVPTESYRFGPGDAKPIENVFGVRMASVAVAAEINYSKVNLLNNGDLVLGRYMRHVIRVVDFLKRVENVEPQYKNGSTNVAERAGPNLGYFQVLGHILVKKVNSPNGVDFDKDCPLVIEYDTKGNHFFFGANKVEKLCTDDSKLWSASGKKIVYELREIITFTHTEL